MAVDVIRENFVGKWKYYDGEQFNEFLAEMASTFENQLHKKQQVEGVGSVTRKLACMATPIETITVDGDTIKIVNHYHVLVKDHVFTFKLGEEFEQMVEGNKMKTVASVEDNKLKMELHPVNPACKVKPQLCYREIVGNDLILKVTVGDVVCIRKFKRQ